MSWRAASSRATLKSAKDVVVSRETQKVSEQVSDRRDGCDQNG